MNDYSSNFGTAFNYSDNQFFSIFGDNAQGFDYSENFNTANYSNNYFPDLSDIIEDYGFDDPKTNAFYSYLFKFVGDYFTCMQLIYYLQTFPLFTPFVVPADIICGNNVLKDFWHMWSNDKSFMKCYTYHVFGLAVLSTVVLTASSVDGGIKAYYALCKVASLGWKGLLGSAPALASVAKTLFSSVKNLIKAPIGSKVSTGLSREIMNMRSVLRYMKPGGDLIGSSDSAYQKLYKITSGMMKAGSFTEESMKNMRTNVKALGSLLKNNIANFCMQSDIPFESVHVQHNLRQMLGGTNAKLAGKLLSGGGMVGLVEIDELIADILKNDIASEMKNFSKAGSSLLKPVKEIGETIVKPEMSVAQSVIRPMSEASEAIIKPVSQTVSNASKTIASNVDRARRTLKYNNRITKIRNKFGNLLNKKTGIPKQELSYKDLVEKVTSQDIKNLPEHGQIEQAIKESNRGLFQKASKEFIEKSDVIAKQAFNEIKLDELYKSGKIAYTEQLRYRSMSIYNNVLNWYHGH